MDRERPVTPAIDDDHDARAAHPPHHDGVLFRNPWPDAAPPGFRAMVKWAVERRRVKRPPDPAPGTFLSAPPAFAERAGPGELTATWVGQSTVLLQLGGINVLTDPVWSDRASPVPFAGPRRVTAPGVTLERLPPIDVVLLSHNHYDHLDRRTVRALARRMPGIDWVVPLRLGATIARWGAKIVRELDWWSTTTVTTAHGTLEIGGTPAQHFSARGPRDRNRSLWCGFALRQGARRVYFAGDTARHPEFGRIAERFGPFDLVVLPVGAYEPRWFMKYVHMNPEDAMHAYASLAGAHPTSAPPAMLGVHWGTFRLTDEAMEEPTARTAALWRAAAHDESLLWLLRHGETRRARSTVSATAPSPR